MMKWLEIGTLTVDDYKKALRIKLAKELYKKDCQNVLYNLDEPTTGLLEEDVEKVIVFLARDL